MARIIRRTPGNAGLRINVSPNMARNPDPKPGRWILPLVILGMVFFTWAFVQRLEVPALEDDQPVSTTTTTIATTPTTLPEETTTTTLLPPELRTYLDNLLGDKDTLGDVVSEMNAVNSDWDGRAETGKTFPEAEEDLVAVNDSALVFSEAVELHLPPAGIAGLVEAHEAALSAALQVASTAEEVLAGLQAPDTGQLRQEALISFRLAAEQFNLAVDSINSIITQGSGG